MSKHGNTKYPGRRSRSYLKEKYFVYIATEGSKTEEQYFQFDFFKSTRIKIITIPSQGGRSDPKHVLDNLLKRKRKERRYINKDDQFWVVFDVDDRPQRNISDVVSRAYDNKVKLAISNPCFEIWLYLHHSQEIPSDENLTCQKIGEIIRLKIGEFNKAKLKFDHYNGRIDMAISNAKSLDSSSPSDRWPQRTGTHVYKLVEEILKLI